MRSPTAQSADIVPSEPFGSVRGRLGGKGATMADEPSGMGEMDDFNTLSDVGGMPVDAGDVMPGTPVAPSTGGAAAPKRAAPKRKAPKAAAKRKSGGKAKSAKSTRKAKASKKAAKGKAKAASRTAK